MSLENKKSGFALISFNNCCKLCRIKLRSFYNKNLLYGIEILYLILKYT